MSHSAGSAEWFSEGRVTIASSRRIMRAAPCGSATFADEYGAARSEDGRRGRQRSQLTPLTAKQNHPQTPDAPLPITFNLSTLEPMDHLVSSVAARALVARCALVAFAS